MRSPAHTLAGNLRFTRSGTVWADWLLSPIPYGFRPDKDKHVVRGLHQALLRALPGESLLQGVCSGLDAGAVVERMIDGVDLSACPDWAAECEATLDTLDAISPGQRSYWLSVPLGATSGLDRLREPLRSATSGLRDALALPRAGVPAADLERRLEQARRVQQAIPHLFRPRPATAAQMLWLHLHAQQRGALLDLDVPDSGSTDLAGQLLAPRTGMTLPEPMLDEGGQSDLPRRGLRSWNPTDRRYLKVTQPGRPDLPAASYQALMVLTDVPNQGMVFPGSEFLGRIDESGLEVDWAIRLQVLGSHDATLKNRKALVNLNEQYSQREGEQSHGLTTLDRAASELAEYAAVLDGDKFEVEVQPTTIFAVAGPDSKSAGDQARALTGYFADAGYKLSQPLGYQEELWWAMQPGVPANRAVREFAQITTSKALASAVPLASTELGDDRGSLLGLNISSGRPGVALHDMEGAAVRDVSGSVAVVGELGAGKALALDTLVPTPHGWALMGDLVAGDQVLDEQGRPTVVLGTSAVMNGHRCYEVVFSDGEAITADAEHLWTTIPDRVRVSAAKRNTKLRARGSLDELVDLAENTATLTGPTWPEHGLTVTTEQIQQTLLNSRGHSGQANHAVPTTGALQLPPADLPVDPYVLGAWLGDGSSNTAQLTSADPEVLTYIEAAGYTVNKLNAPYLYAISLPQEPRPVLQTHPCAHCEAPTVRTYAHRRYCSRECAAAARRADAAPLGRGTCEVCRRELGATSTGRRCSSCWHQATLRGRLHAMGLLRNKHVPPIYLRGSVEQRQALLAGLLDTDGTVSPNGAVEFTNTNRQLAVDAHELACSLGYRAALREGRARLNGRDCGPKWTVSFTTTEQVFRLPRKRQAQLDRSARSSPARNRFRYVVDVREVPSVPVRCIRVASSSRLFLAGRTMIPTHNSLTLKSLAGDVVDRGGRVVAVDRTQMGEYARWASSVTRATVVDAANPKFSLDPLRLFGPVIGSRVTQTFLTPLLNVAPTSERGVLLSDVLDPAYLDKHAVSSLGGLLAHLADRGPAGCQLSGGGELARVMFVFARRDFGRVVFDPELPVLQPDAPAVVIRTHTLELPSREELEHEHLFTQMGLEKLFGRALYALVAALARQVCFADPARLGVFLVDEAHHVTASPEGEREIAVFSRDGRKHKAAMLLGTHDPEEDLGTATLRGLIPTRILMRHRDKTLAQRGLAYLGLDPNDDELVQMLTEDTSPVTAKGVEEYRRGEAFLRDSSGNIGRIKVLAPALPDRNAAVRTSPPETTSSTASAAGDPA